MKMYWFQKKITWKAFVIQGFAATSGDKEGAREIGKRKEEGKREAERKTLCFIMKKQMFLYNNTVIKCSDFCFYSSGELKFILKPWNLWNWITASQLTLFLSIFWCPFFHLQWKYWAFPWFYYLSFWELNETKKLVLPDRNRISLFFWMEGKQKSPFATDFPLHDALLLWESW